LPAPFPLLRPYDSGTRRGYRGVMILAACESCGKDVDAGATCANCRSSPPRPPSAWHPLAYFGWGLLGGCGASSLISAPLWLFGLIAMDWRDLGQGPQPLYDHVVWYVLVPTFDVCAVVFAISAIVAFYYRAALLASGLSLGLSGTLFWLWHSVPFPANS
jgi:hypothetical protein